MDIIIIAFALMLLLSLRKSKGDFLSKENCLSVRGMMAFVIIFGHLAQRTGGGKLFSQSLKLSAICVGIYFFMSGYGLMEQYTRKGKCYLDTFIQRRIGELLFRYVLISGIYLILRNTLFEDPYYWSSGVRQGRPIVYFSWYIIELLVLYITFYVSGKNLSEKHRKEIGIIVGCAIIALDILFSRIGYGDYWYNSNLCFAIGILVSTCKIKVEKALNKVNAVEVLTAIVILGTMCFKVDDVVGTQIKCVIGVAVLLMALEKMQLQGNILQYCGEISLELYLWQGMFMYGMRNSIIYIKNDVIYSLVTIGGTFLISVISNVIWEKAKQFYVNIRRI